MTFAVWRSEGPCIDGGMIDDRLNKYFLAYAHWSIVHDGVDKENVYTIKLTWDKLETHLLITGIPLVAQS